MARGIFGGRGAILASVIAAGAFAGGGCFYPSYEVVADGPAGSGGAGGSGSGGSGGSGGGASGPCKAVGSETPLACNQANPSAIAVNLNSIFWTNEDSGEVLKMPRMGGEPVVIAKGLDRPCGIAVNNDFVVWRTRGGLLGGAYFATIGLPDEIDSALGESCALSVAGDLIYTFNMNGNGGPELQRRTFTGAPGPPVPVASMPVAIAASPAHIYWTIASTQKIHVGIAFDPMMQNQHNILNPCGLAASEQLAVATSSSDKKVAVFMNGNPFKVIDSPSPPCAAAVNAAGVFWLDHSAGQVYSASLANSLTPQPQANGPAPACAIAVHGPNIYWTSCEKGVKSGRIMRFGK